MVQTPARTHITTSLQHQWPPLLRRSVLEGIMVAAPSQNHFDKGETLPVPHKEGHVCLAIGLNFCLFAVLCFFLPKINFLNRIRTTLVRKFWLILACCRKLQYAYSTVLVRLCLRRPSCYAQKTKALFCDNGQIISLNNIVQNGSFHFTNPRSITQNSCVVLQSLSYVPFSCTPYTHRKILLATHLILKHKLITLSFFFHIFIEPINLTFAFCMRFFLRAFIRCKSERFALCVVLRNFASALHYYIEHWLE